MADVLYVDSGPHQGDSGLCGLAFQALIRGFRVFVMAFSRPVCWEAGISIQGLISGPDSVRFQVAEGTCDYLRNYILECRILTQECLLGKDVLCVKIFGPGWPPLCDRKRPPPMWLTSFT